MLGGMKWGGGNMAVDKEQWGKLRLFDDIARMERRRKGGIKRPFLEHPWVDGGTLAASDGRVLATAPLAWLGLPADLPDGVFTAFGRKLLTFREGRADGWLDYRAFMPRDKTPVGTYALGGAIAGTQTARLLLDSRVPVDVELLQMVKMDVTAYKVAGMNALVLEHDGLSVLVMGFRMDEGENK